MTEDDNTKGPTEELAVQGAMILDETLPLLTSSGGDLNAINKALAHIAEVLKRYPDAPITPRTILIIQQRGLIQ